MFSTPPDPIGAALKNLKSSTWTDWLVKNIKTVPSTFLPNTTGLATSHSRANTEPGNNFPNLSTANSVQAAEKLVASEFKNFEDFLSYMSKCRRDMESTLKGWAQQFGLLRGSDDDIQTPVYSENGVYTDQYKSLLSGLLSFADSKDDKIPGMNIRKEFGTYQYYEYPFEKPTMVPYYLITVEIKNNDQVLSNISIFQIRNTHLQTEYINYYHTQGKDLASLSKNECEILFQKIQKWTRDKNKSEAENEKDFYELLGSFAWYLGQATPCFRGSAAASDMMIKSLLLSKQFIPKSYKAGIGWDFRAISTATPEEFGKTFYNLFEDRPPFKDRFEVNPERIQKHHDILDQAWAEEKVKSTGRFKNQNIKVSLTHDTQFDSLVVRSDQPIIPSSHRTQSRRENIINNGHEKFYANRHNFGAGHLEKLKGKISQQKWDLLNKEDHYHGVWSFFCRDIVGESYVKRGGPSIDSIIEWLNSKSYEFLEQICAQHDRLEETLFWIEKLSSTDRKLINEDSYTREQITGLGVDGLKQKLTLAKHKDDKEPAASPAITETPSSSTKLLVESWKKTNLLQDIKEEKLTPKELAKQLLTKLRYRQPRKCDEYEIEGAENSSDSDLVEKVKNYLSHREIEKALTKVSNGEKLEAADIDHLKVGQDRFTSLQKDFLEIISAKVAELETTPRKARDSS